MKKMLFTAERLVFKGSPNSVPEQESQQSTEKPLSMPELNKQAKEALETARAEKLNIEKLYGSANSNGEFSSVIPPEIREQYKNLSETIRKLEKLIGKEERAIMEESLRVFNKIAAALDDYAVKSKDQVFSRDPFAMAYERAPKPSTETIAAPEAPTREEKPTAGAPETPDQMENRIFTDFCGRFADGSNEITPEEAQVFRKALKPGEITLFDTPADSTHPARSYEFEISNNKKWIRVTMLGGPDKDTGIAKSTSETALPLEPGETSTPEFSLKTRNELVDARVESNRKILKDQLNWLESDKAPVGSTVILSVSEFARQNSKTGIDEKGVQSTVVRKGVGGLRMTTFEYLTDENGKPLSAAKEVPPEQRFTMEKAMAIVSEKATTVRDGDEKDRKAELKRKLGKLGELLIGQIPFGGLDSPNFKNTLTEMKRIFDQFNVTKCSYRDNIMGQVQRYEKGVLTIYDPEKKNPRYVSAEETPNVQRYAVNIGPIDMMKYAPSEIPERKAA